MLGPSLRIKKKIRVPPPPGGRHIEIMTPSASSVVPDQYFLRGESFPIKYRTSLNLEVIRKMLTKLWPFCELYFG